MSGGSREGNCQFPASVADEISFRLRQLGDPVKAGFLQGFFKTGPGGYAEGDLFIGVKVPEVRGLLKEHRKLTPEQIMPLLVSGIHEERLFALLALVRCFDRGDALIRESVYDLYLANTGTINNWDLVDCSAPAIVGGHLLGGDTEPLYRLARSTSLWVRRIAIMATFTFIRHNRFDDTLAICRMLLGDCEDLIHKATGWMLREVGKRNQYALEEFLRMHCRVMPRTMLRYAIEKFPADKRRMYLDGSC